MCILFVIVVIDINILLSVNQLVRMFTIVICAYLMNSFVL